MTIKDLSRYKHYKNEAERLRQRLKSEIVTDTVSGSSPEYPYTKHSITIQGLQEKHQAQLHTAYLKAYSELIKLEQFVQSVNDPLVRDIIRLRFEDGLKWEQVADKIVGYTSEALRKRLIRYLRGKHYEKANY